MSASQITELLTEKRTGSGAKSEKIYIKGSSFFDKYYSALCVMLRFALLILAKCYLSSICLICGVRGEMDLWSVSLPIASQEVILVYID